MVVLFRLKVTTGLATGVAQPAVALVARVAVSGEPALVPVGGGAVEPVMDGEEEADVAGFEFDVGDEADEEEFWVAEGDGLALILL